MIMSDFQGLRTRILKNDQVCLEYLVDSGPRIVRLSAFGEENLFANVPNSVSTPHGEFFFRGGHRLWRAPEVMPDTYLPDNAGVSVEELPDGVRLHGKPAIENGIGKTIDIHLSKDRAVITLTHVLQNEGQNSVELAPWAITMFRLGGTVILPQPVGNTDKAGFLHNRILALWPYTHINDPRLRLRDDFILIRADPIANPFKLGYYNPNGWMAYWLDGILFRKTFDATSSPLKFPDNGCNTESYCNDRFVELESLGALTTLKYGEEVRLTETWELFQGLEEPFLTEEIRKLV